MKMEKTKLENSVYCRNILLLTTAATGMAVSYHFTFLNPMVPVILDIYNNTYEVRYKTNLSENEWTTLLSLTMSMVIAGGFCGAMTVQYVLKILSRKQTMILWHSIHIVGIIIIAAVGGSTGSYEAFICGRFVVGYGLGLAINITPICVAEFCVHDSQAKYQSIMGLFLAFGSVVGPAMGHNKILGAANRWIAAVAFPVIFSAIYLCCIPWIPESPFTLLRQSKKTDAIAVVKKLRSGTEEDILNEIRIMEEEQDGFKEEFASEDDVTKEHDRINIVDLKGVLTHYQYRRQLFTVCMLYAGFQTTGLNHVLFYSDQIFLNAGISDEYVTYATLGVFCAQFIGSIVGIKVLTIIGSRKHLLGSSFLIIVSHVIIVVSLSTYHLANAVGYISVIGVFVLLVSATAGPNLTVFALAGELTIEPTRQTVLNYGGGCLWFFAWLVGFSASYLDAAMGSYSFLMWCGATIIYFVLIYLFVPETKGKSVEEIQRLLMRDKL